MEGGLKSRIRKLEKQHIISLVSNIHSQGWLSGMCQSLTYSHSQGTFLEAALRSFSREILCMVPVPNCSTVKACSIGSIPSPEGSLERGHLRLIFPSRVGSVFREVNSFPIDLL